jgi:hypothetical protein
MHSTTSCSRPLPRVRGTGRRTATAAGSALLLALTAVAPAASAQQSFLDPADPCPPGVEVTPADFNDRDQISETHVLNVDCGAALDVVLGEEDGDFDPLGMTRRDQMASFIVRGLEAAGYEDRLPAPSDQGFEDIDDSTHKDAINILAEIGVTKGVTDTTFEPRTLVARDQMASFILRAAEFAFDDVDGFEGTGLFDFSDIPDGNVHRENILAAAELLGLTDGVSDDQFDPYEPTSRQQMATFVVRLIDVILLTD